MRERTVSQSITARKLVSVSPQASVYDAACVMAKARCGSVLVLGEDEGMLGIFTERDLMTRVVAKGLVPASTSISDVMTPNPRSVLANMPVSEAVLLMREGGFRHLPIVSNEGNVLAVFSLRDAMPREIIDADQLAEHFDQEFSNVLG
jgi:CBS domain-containing protein